MGKRIIPVKYIRSDRSGKCRFRGLIRTPAVTVVSSPVPVYNLAVGVSGPVRFLDVWTHVTKLINLYILNL